MKQRWLCFRTGWPVQIASHHTGQEQSALAKPSIYFLRQRAARLTAGPQNFRNGSGIAYVIQITSFKLFKRYILYFGPLSGDEGIRTPDLRRAKAALSQLSYIPGTSRVSGPFRTRT